MCKRSTHRGEGEMRPQRADHVLGEVRLVRVPHEADGNDLRGVHEDASDPDLLPTFALRERRRPKNTSSNCTDRGTVGESRAYRTVPKVPDGACRL